MKRTFLLAAFLCGYSAILVGAGLMEINPPPPGDSSQITALRVGRLVDVRQGESVEDAVVVVRGGRILGAGPSESVNVPADAKRIDASGLTALPGFIDSHFHSVNNLRIPALFLEHGVTTFRDPGHPFRFYQAVLQTERPMPRVFLCGAHLDAYPPIWPQQARLIQDAEDARRAVFEHVDRGAAAIKIYFRLPLEVFSAVCRAADERGVPVTAHLELVRADDAIRAGVRGVEHITSFGTALANPRDAERFRSRVSENPSSRSELRYWLWSQIDLDDESKTKPLLDLIVDNHVYVSPTLALFEKRAVDKDANETQIRAFENMLRFTGMCHRAGAVVVGGSHTHVPHAELGWAFQRELELLVEAGLTPMEALRAGTWHNARFFGAEERLGSLETGKAADLILVEGNPDQDIKAAYQVRHVMLNGNWATQAP